MDNFFSDFEKQLELANSLNEYRISIETYNEDEVIEIVSSELSGENLKLTAEEVIYLTEYGTIVFPGRHFFDHFLLYCEQRLDLVFDEILNGIFELDYSTVQIERILMNFETEMNAYINSYLVSFADKNYLAKLIGSKEDQFLVSPSILTNHIRCKIYKNFIFLA